MLKRTGIPSIVKLGMVTARESIPHRNVRAFRTAFISYFTKRVNVGPGRCFVKFEMLFWETRKSGNVSDLLSWSSLK